MFQLDGSDRRRRLGFTLCWDEWIGFFVFGGYGGCNLFRRMDEIEGGGREGSWRAAKMTMSLCREKICDSVLTFTSVARHTNYRHAGK